MQGMPSIQAIDTGAVDAYRAGNERPAQTVPDDHQDDLDLIAGIPSVPSILDVVCRMTGMGFAVVARVTPGRWIACSTKDEIGFGLKPGGELKVDTTICHEIRRHPEPVIIEDVASDAAYRDHPTPALYGFRSYVSFPIVLPDGTFFGTLCAIDPQPRTLRTPETIGTFKLFAELIATHIESGRQLGQMRRLLDERRDADQRQRILQRELAHRMKNTLAMVQAIVTQSLRNARSLDDVAQVVGARIQALGRAQDMLTETRWETADIGEVVAASIAPHDGGSRFVLEGPPADLTAQQGMGLALALHELATNAAKYGSLSNAVGTVAIRWDRDGDRIRLEWREAGGPPIEALPERSGFGSRLTTRIVPAYFNGEATLEYDRDGVVYALSGTLLSF